MTKDQLKQLEADLWRAADNLRANSDLKPSEYSTPVLGLIFLKFTDNNYRRHEAEIIAEYQKLKGTRREKKLSDIAIEKCGFYLPDHARYDHLLNLPEGKDYGTASSATHVAVVEVDRETYAVKVLRYVVVEDCGRVINPLIVDGQVRGGVAQGIGAALYEEVVYDENGQLLTGSLMDYLVPTAAELLPIEVHHVETPLPSTIGGFRGMGEGGTIGAPAAIANAVSDALSPLGIEINELPLTPNRLFRLIQEASDRKKDGNNCCPGPRVTRTEPYEHKTESLTSKAYKVYRERGF